MNIPENENPTTPDTGSPSTPQEAPAESVNPDSPSPPPADTSPIEGAPSSASETLAEPAIEPNPTPENPPPTDKPSEPPAEASAEAPPATTYPAELVLASEPPAEASAEAPAEPKQHALPALPAQPVPEVPKSPHQNDLSRIAQDFQIRKMHVEAVVEMIDAGNTVPFITRYRKERTGGLDEEVIRKIQSRVEALRSLADRKQTILKSIAGQGRLTDGLVQAILDADLPKRLEDLYLPFKPKKRSLAADARDKGLEPLAMAIWNADPAVSNLSEVFPGIVDPEKKLATVEDVATGVRHILAEVIAELADVRGAIRAFLRDTAVMIVAKVDNVPEGKGQEYRDYFDFKEPVRRIPPHRILAVNRGEHEKIIRIKLDADARRVRDIIARLLNFGEHPHREFLGPVLDDATDRLLLPSLEREIRREMTEFAQDHGVDIFARNLRSLLLRAPLGGIRILAVDPAIRTGCKLAVLDETGTLLEHAVVYPHAPQNQVGPAKRKMEQLIRKHGTTIIAIGNGTGCRETEEIVSEMLAEFEQRRINPQPIAATEAPMLTAADMPTIPAEAAPEVVPPPTSMESVFATVSTPTGGAAETMVSGLGEGTTMGESSVSSAPSAGDAPPQVVSAPPTPAPAPMAPPVPVIDLTGLPEPPADLVYVVVNEAGASDYSASPVAKEEFPDLDATLRGTVSIGRRLQDPLAELVKIDPQHVGVGLYQHDMRPKYMKETLEAVIESCVNAVGVDVNTASVPLLRHVSGMNQLVARELVEYRKNNGPFKSREQLMSVPQMGETRFTQAAGFLKIREGTDPLDYTWVHPESYPIARQLLSEMGYTPADILDKNKIAEIREKLRTQNPEALANIFKVGGVTVRDIFEAIARPGRDIREDRPQPIFRRGVLKLEDLKPGMELKGEVLNVVDFGAFVDIGLKDSGLVHISQIANRFIKSPYDVVGVGDVVTVYVMAIDNDRKRVSLSMIPPGVERAPRIPDAPREQREPREPRPPRRPPPQGGPGGPGPRQFADQQRSPGPNPEGGPGPRNNYPPRQEGGPPRQEGGPPQGQGGRPPRPPMGMRGPGPGPGGPPRGPRPGQGPGGPQREQAPQTPMPPQPQPRPAKPKTVPKLSTEQKAGKSALNTFAELAAFFTPPAPPAPPPPPPEAKKPEPPAAAAPNDTPPPPPSETGA